MHVLCVCVSSGFSGFIQPPKNTQICGLGVNECMNVSVHDVLSTVDWHPLQCVVSHLTPSVLGIGSGFTTTPY